MKLDGISARPQGRRGGGALPVVAGLAMAFLALAGPVPAQGQPQAFRLLELGTLSEGTSIVVRGPNLAGAAVGGGRPVLAGRIASARQGLLFEAAGLAVIGGFRRDEYTTVFGINDAGQLVGSSNAERAVRAFTVARGGAIRELPPLPGDSASFAFAINNRNESVGYSSGDPGERAVIWRGGVPSVLPSPAGDSRAMSINERSDVAGSIEAGDVRQALLWRGASTAQPLLPLPGFGGSEAAHVNGRGDVLGYSFGTRGPRLATVWPAGRGPVELAGLPGAVFSQALGGNDAGQAVGFSGDAHATRAVLWSQEGVPSDLNTLVSAPGLLLTKAVGINNAGAILALAIKTEAGHDGHSHGHEHELPQRVVLLTRTGG